MKAHIPKLGLFNRAGLVIGSNDRIAQGLLTACLGLATYYFLVLLLAPVRDFHVGRFHLLPNNFFFWAPAQIIPSMYSFDNRFTVSYSRVTDLDSCKANTVDTPTYSAIAELDDRSCILLNSPHFFPVYPLPFFKPSLVQKRPKLYITARSRFMDIERQSEWVLEWEKYNPAEGKLFISNNLD